jgi:hypothetical protein
MPSRYSGCMDRWFHTRYDCSLLATIAVSTLSILRLLISSLCETHGAAILTSAAPQNLMRCDDCHCIYGCLGDDQPAAAVGRAVQHRVVSRRTSRRYNSVLVLLPEVDVHLSTYPMDRHIYIRSVVGLGPV